MNIPAQTSEPVIRLSLTGVLLALLAMAGVGLAGGMLGQWWWSPNTGPLPAGEDRLLTTIQEVTISPSVATAEAVQRQQRSVVLLARAEGGSVPFASGFVVTSDGLVATAADLPEGSLVMIDETGRALPVERVGRDTVFGISYVRSRDGVFSPFDVRDSVAPVGFTLITLSRNPATLSARVQAYTVEEYRLPERPDPAGWQRLLGGMPAADPAMAGSPLLDDEGRVAGLVLPGSSGRVLSSVELRYSLERVAAQQLEVNPYEQLGLGIDFGFQAEADGGRLFAILVESVTPASVAAREGMRAGDVIAAVDGNSLAWDAPVFEEFRSREPLTLQVRRGEAARAVTLDVRATPAPSP